MNRHLSVALCVFWISVASGCSSDDSPTSPNGSGSQTTKPDPSFASDIQEIFDRRGCSSAGCHGAAQSEGLDLRASNSFGELVNADATQTAGKRVIPGDAAGSYLVVKLEGRQSTGGQMPLGGSPLNSTDLQNIKNWINQGAKNN